MRFGPDEPKTEKETEPSQKRISKGKTGNQKETNKGEFGVFKGVIEMETGTNGHLKEETTPLEAEKGQWNKRMGHSAEEEPNRKEEKNKMETVETKESRELLKKEEKERGNLECMNSSQRAELQLHEISYFSDGKEERKRSERTSEKEVEISHLKGKERTQSKELDKVSESDGFSNFVSSFSHENQIKPVSFIASQRTKKREGSPDSKGQSKTVAKKTLSYFRGTTMNQS